MHHYSMKPHRSRSRASLFALQVFALHAAFSSAVTCPSGYALTDRNIDGIGKHFASASTILQCAQRCTTRKGCKAFEYSAEETLCGTYSDGFWNVQPSNNFGDWVSCVAYSSPPPPPSPPMPGLPLSLCLATPCGSGGGTCSDYVVNFTCTQLFLAGCDCSSCCDDAPPRPPSQPPPVQPPPSPPLPPFVPLPPNELKMTSLETARTLVYFTALIFAIGLFFCCCAALQRCTNASFEEERKYIVSLWTSTRCKSVFCIACIFDGLVFLLAFSPCFYLRATKCAHAFCCLPSQSGDKPHWDRIGAKGRCVLRAIIVVWLAATIAAIPVCYRFGSSILAVKNNLLDVKEDTLYPLASVSVVAPAVAALLMTCLYWIYAIFFRCTPRGDVGKSQRERADEAEREAKAAQEQENVAKKKREVIDEEIKGVCTFTFIKADFIRQGDAKKCESMRYQNLKQQDGDVFHSEQIERDKVFGGEYSSDTRKWLAISHRWEDQAKPDVHGKQLEQVQEFLKENKQYEFVWYDYWCVPQMDADGKRTEVEEIEFKWQRSNANLLYIGLDVLAIIDLSYQSRFWTQLELWLSLQQVTIHGLRSTMHGEQRLFCRAIHTATEKQAEATIELWRGKTHDDATKMLELPDVYVTYHDDKEEQLEQLRQLNELAISFARAAGRTVACKRAELRRTLQELKKEESNAEEKRGKAEEKAKRLRQAADRADASRQLLAKLRNSFSQGKRYSEEVVRSTGIDREQLVDRTVSDSVTVTVYH